MTHPIDSAIQDLNSKVESLLNAEKPALAAKVAECRDELRAFALEQLGPMRRYRAIIGYTGKNWLGEPYRVEHIVTQITVEFISRSLPQDELGEVAKRVIYCNGHMFRENEWRVISVDYVSDHG